MQDMSFKIHARRITGCMYVDETPIQLTSLEKLEQVPIDSQFSIL